MDINAILPCKNQAAEQAARVLYWLSPIDDAYLDSMGISTDAPIRKAFHLLPEAFRVAWNLTERQLERNKLKILAAPSQLHSDNAMPELLLFLLLSSATMPALPYKAELCLIANFLVTNELYLRT